MAFLEPDATGIDMSNDELLGMHERLRDELSTAYAKPSWDTPHINRITDELAAVERLLAFSRVTDRWSIARVRAKPHDGRKRSI